MIDRETVDRIYAAANIVDIIGEYVTLKRKGVNYQACCPFHNEKTPSFVVSPSKGVYKCFGCGKGGNAVTFLMEHENITYPEALKMVAKRYGIEVKEKEMSEEEVRRNDDRESMFALNGWAADYFSNYLHHETEGMSVGMTYFRQKRGMTDATIKKFGLGFCPARGDRMSKDALAAGYKKEFLVSTGLSLERESDGSLYDRFRDRVIFPVHNISGRIVAFGGRTLRTDKTVAKYQNSPESEIYSKKRELYGLYFAKKAIQQLDFAIMVEGYTDVISMHQAGVENVVSSSGTSLTTEQIRLLNRSTKNITVIYDGDSAGIHASLRGIDMILREGMNVRVVLLPEPEDPDSFARRAHCGRGAGIYPGQRTGFPGLQSKIAVGGRPGRPDPEGGADRRYGAVDRADSRSDPAVGLHQGVRADHGHRREHPDLGGGAQAHGDDRRPRGRRIRTPPDGVAEGGGPAARGGIREAGRGREQHRGARTRTGEIPAQIRPLFVRVQGGAHDGGVQRRGGDLPGTGQRRAYVLQSAIQQYFGN